MKKKENVDPIANYLQSAQNILTDFSDLWDEKTATPLKQELERLQKNYCSAESSFRNTADENLKVAVVGSFSCGKSSFINSILEDEVAPVEIKPMTHGVTSFIYGETEKYDADGKEISREEYQKFVQDADNDTQHFIVSYPCERLKKLEFMDSPGFGSVSEGNEEQDEKAAERDNKLCDDSIARADVVFFLSNITEGVIPNDAFKRLKDICNPSGASNPNRRIYIILTWADRKTASQREDIRNSIVELCESEKLNICDYRVYSSMPIEKMKEKHQEFFSKAREELFSTVRNLQIIGAELISYRKGFDNLVFNLHLRQFLEKIQSEIPGIKKKLGTAEHLKKQLIDKITSITHETVNYVCEIFEDKFAANRTSLIYDEKHTWSDDIISVVKYGDFVTLSAGEIHSISKEFQKNSERNGIALESCSNEELKTFFSSDTSSRTESSGLYRQVSYYPNDGYFSMGSLADTYLKVCVSLLNEAGGPWQKQLWGEFLGQPDERGPYINKKLQEIKKIFDRQFRKKINDAFCSEYFLSVLVKTVVEPQVSDLEKRIKKLSSLGKELVYKVEVPKKKEVKKEENTNKKIQEPTKNLSADDIFDML